MMAGRGGLPTGVTADGADEAVPAWVALAHRSCCSHLPSLVAQHASSTAHWTTTKSSVLQYAFALAASAILEHCSTHRRGGCNRADARHRVGRGERGQNPCPLWRSARRPRPANRKLLRAALVPRRQVG